MLYNAGFKTLRDLRNSKPAQLLSIPTIGFEVARSIYEQVGATLEKSEWDNVKAKKATESEQEGTHTGGPRQRGLKYPDG